MQPTISFKQKFWLFIQALKKHGGIIALLSVMGSVFLGSGLATLFYAQDVGLYFLGGFFTLIGAGLWVANVVMNTSSVGYYYQGKLSQTYGKNHMVKVTRVEMHTHVERETNKQAVNYAQVIDTQYYYDVSILLNGQELTALYEPPKGQQHLTKFLVKGLVISVRMVPNMTHTLRVSPRKLTKQLRILADQLPLRD